MTVLHRKRMILVGIGLLVLILLVYGFLPKPTLVETEVVVRGPLRVIVEEEGVTQVVDRYVIGAPTNAYVRRTDLEVGDAVQAGQVLVQLEPPRAQILDPRTRAEADARVAAARAGVARADDEVNAARAAAEQAVRERERIGRLEELGSATRQQLEQIEAESKQATARVQAAEAAAVAARADHVAAQAALQSGGAPEGSLAVRDVVRAPASGRVLAVHQESDGMVTTGTPLVEIGDTRSLEIRVDVLSQDAVRITPGLRVVIDEWGGGSSLTGQVARVEPQAFTEVSSLGVREQRVGVIARVTSDEAAARRLGAGYRVLARFILWEGANVLQVSTSALFKTDRGWAVFVVDDGKARKREVRIGHQTGLNTEIVNGLAPGDAVIVHPANTLEEGASVRVRNI